MIVISYYIGSIVSGLISLLFLIYCCWNGFLSTRSLVGVMVGIHMSFSFFYVAKYLDEETPLDIKIERVWKTKI